MSKKMNLSNLKTLESKTFQSKKVICGNYEVIIDITFRESKIADMVKELMKTVDYITKNKIDIDFGSYGMILVFKYFTDIEFGDELEKQYEVLKILVDLGYFKTIFESFDEKEIEKVTKRFNEIKDELDKLNNENKAKSEIKESETKEE
jgi:hypothetical protein